VKIQRKRKINSKKRSSQSTMKHEVKKGRCIPVGWGAAREQKGKVGSASRRGGVDGERLSLKKK